MKQEKGARRTRKVSEPSAWKERKSLSHFDRRTFPSMAGQGSRRGDKRSRNARKKSPRSQVGMLRYCGTKRVGREGEIERERGERKKKKKKKKISKSCESREFDAKVSRGSPRFSLLRICVPPLHTWRGFPWNGGKKRKKKKKKNGGEKKDDDRSGRTGLRHTERGPRIGGFPIKFQLLVLVFVERLITPYLPSFLPSSNAYKTQKADTRTHTCAWTHWFPFSSLNLHRRFPSFHRKLRFFFPLPPVRSSRQKRKGRRKRGERIFWGEFHRFLFFFTLLERLFDFERKKKRNRK